MAVKGKQKEQKDFVKELFVGFTTVKVVAINPNRDELNKLIGRETSPEEKELVYFGNDQEGHDRLRLAFWLEDINTKKLFVNSFNLTNKDRKNKDGEKVQIINSICTTSWAPLVKNSKGEVTDKVDDSNLPEWFLHFTDRDSKEILGNKKWRKSVSGEEELAILLRSWLGRLSFTDPETEVLVDTKKLFTENLKELKGLISLDSDGNFSEDGYDSPFVVLLGVRTDEDDSTKKYQQVWSKGFLPANFMKYINLGNKFPTDYAKRMWKKFQEDATGDYGFDSFTSLTPISEYDVTKDIAGGNKVATEAPEPHSSDY